MIFLEHMCFAFLGAAGIEGQETERFLGDRKSTRLLVGWEDLGVFLWASEREINAWEHLPTTSKTTLQMVIFNKLEKKYFT
jgi:hypothetical protein